MKRPYVIAINAVSGGGKTTLAKLVHESLPNSALFCFDDFDATNVYPTDYYEWYIRGGNLEEFDCPGMRAAVDAELHRGEKQYIVMDYPFGRDHSRFRDAIDLSVWLETPLDVAMARRILRDFMPHAGASAQEQMDRLKEDIITIWSRAGMSIWTTGTETPAILCWMGGSLWKNCGTASSKPSTAKHLADNETRPVKMPACKICWSSLPIMDMAWFSWPYSSSKWEYRFRVFPFSS